MRKVLLLLGILCALTGCSSKKEVETQPVQYSGLFISYTESDGSVFINIDVDGVERVILLSSDTLPDSSILPGYGVVVIGESYVDGSGEFATSVVVESVPLEVELGYDGAYLMSKECDTLYQSLLAQVDYEYSINNNGRDIYGESRTSYYINQDEKAIYINILGNSRLGNISDNWSSMEYIDRVTKNRYYNYNYGEWDRSYTRDVDKVSFALPCEFVNVGSFYREGSNLVVEGSCSSVDGTYIEYLLGQTFEGVDCGSIDTDICFTAKFDETTGLLFYSEYTVIFNGVVPSNDGDINVVSLTILLSGINFNNVDTVDIPDYVR